MDSSLRLGVSSARPAAGRQSAAPGPLSQLEHHALRRTACAAQQAPAQADQGYQVQESETYIG